MKRFKISHYLIGVINGILFTFAFLFFIVGMDEEFHFMDVEEPLGVDTIAFMDLSSYNIEDIESEYFKRRGPENILDKLLHQYSMVGTIWEEKWDSISDIEKVSILLYDTGIADILKHKKKRKEKGSKEKCFVICPLVFIAGYIDAVAGGGGLVSLPAYLITGLSAGAKTMMVSVTFFG